MLEDKYILVIEDDFDLQWLIKKILLLNGFQVLTAVTAEQAIEEFSRHLFDIQAIILDLSLPDQSGLSLCAEFKKVSPDIPIIVTTGSEEREVRKQAEGLGVAGYLIKPFDIINLVRLLSKIVIKQGGM